MKPDSAPSKRISLFSLLRALRRRAFYLLIPVVVLVPAVAFYAIKHPLKFRGRALVGAEPIMQSHLTFGNLPDANAVLSAQEEARAIRGILFSEPVLAGVIREFNLYPAANSDQERKATEALKRQIDVQIEGPDAFYLSFDGQQPEQVMRVTNRLAELFVQRTVALRDRRADQEDGLLDNEVADFRKRLDQQEENLKTYKQSGAQELPERLADNLKQLATLQEQIQSKADQITEAQAKRSADLAEISGIEKQGALEPEPREKTPTELQVDDLRRKLSELRARYTPEHPEIVRLQREIRDLEANAPPPPPVPHHQPSQIQMRYLTLQSELKTIDPRIAAYQQERNALIGELQNYQRVVNSSPGYETALTERVRDLAVTRSSFESLLAKQQDAKLHHRAEKDTDGVAYELLERASLPTSPVGPHRSRMILLAIVASFGLGFAGIVIAERLDTTFETGEDFEAFSDLPLLATVPGIPNEKSTTKTVAAKAKSGATPASGQLTAATKEHLLEHRIAVVASPDSVAAQQYGILALKLQRWMEQSRGKMIAVTSSTGEEGKSLTALNLSLSLASSLEGGVLLVDCDLRLPQIHDRLGLPVERGLTDLLLSGRPDACPFITRIAGLDVMTAGSNAADNTRLISTPHAREVLEHLRTQYRVVVLDTPPIVPIADSHTLSGLADGVLMVVRARRTRPGLFERAIASLEAKNLVGVVLNDVEYAATPYAYAYEYYQRHYLGHG
jgi:polysaccharide chain length determinant protein (PEP-CTERM system associated)